MPLPFFISKMLYMRTRKAPERTNSMKQRVTLLGVIANGSTSDARKLLKNYDEPDATNHQDLEYKLTKLYAKTPDKIEIEKKLAEIHPHKDFILKYCSKPTPTPEQGIEKTKEMIIEPMDSPIQFQDSSKSCACGCGSNFDANSSQPNNFGMNNGVMVLGILGIITIFAITIKK